MAYNKTTWENAPSTNTPINAGNLNKIEEGIYQNSLKADQVGDLSELETINKTSIVNAINSMQGTILWTNSNPNASFVAQDISLSSSDYDFYEIIYKQANDIDRTFNSGLILENTGTILNFNTTTLYFRVVSANSKTSIHFDNGQVGSNANSNAVIPLYIIGYKTELISNV